MRHPPRIWRPSTAELELSDVERESSSSTSATLPDETAELPLPSIPTIPLPTPQRWLPGRWRVESGMPPTAWAQPSATPTPPADSGFTVPLVRVNDVPVSGELTWRNRFWFINHLTSVVLLTVKLNYRRW